MDWQRYGKKIYGRQFFQQFYQQGKSDDMAAALRPLKPLRALTPLMPPQRELRDLLLFVISDKILIIFLLLRRH